MTLNATPDQEPRETEPIKENWSLSGLIIEGICCSGKTTMIQALLQSERFTRKSFLSSIILSEHQTQRVLERKEREEGIEAIDNLALLDQHVSYLESLRDRLDKMEWRQNNRTNMRVPYLLERFHLTHVCHYSHMSWDDVSGIDARLAYLNCKLCLLKIDRSALEQRLFLGRDVGWREYLKRYGKTDEDILEHYSRQQESVMTLCKQTRLDTLIIDATVSGTQKAANQLLDFWGIE